MKYIVKMRLTISLMVVTTIKLMVSDVYTIYFIVARPYLFNSVERYVCMIYGYPREKLVNVVRSKLFDKKFTKGGKVIDMALLPPYSLSLVLHIKRANYVAKIWRSFLTSWLDAEEITESGWLADGETYWVDDIFHWKSRKSFAIKPTIWTTILTKKINNHRATMTTETLVSKVNTRTVKDFCYSTLKNRTPPTPPMLLTFQCKNNSASNEEQLNENLICFGGCNNQKIILNSIEICADSGSIWNKYDQMDPRRTEFASCTYENYIILIGGQGAMQSCTKYNPKNKTFIELEPLPDNRAAHVATIINSTLFICGGCWYTEKSLISLNLNERNGKWRNRKSSLEKRDGSTGCSINNKFYVFGGRNSNSCEYYCPQEDTWRPLLKMKEERFCAGSCYDNNKFIYVVGGRDLRNYNYLTSMERFDVEIGQWLTLKSSIGVGREGLTLTIFKNQIILIGGRDKNNKCYNTIEKYDSISDSWSQIGILKAARSYHYVCNPPHIAWVKVYHGVSFFLPGHALGASYANSPVA
ncbi:Kelch-like protein 1 [Nymphon striatum]|nr:Kelch-like protein 1 [Nymphon striatum]